MTTTGQGACDLCGEHAADLFELRGCGRVMFSDRRTAAGVLRKLRCRRCGLVRGDAAAARASTHYDEHYAQPLAPEHQFFTGAAPIARSAVFADWMTAAPIDRCWADARRILEVGAGNAHLMERLVHRFPHASIEGTELGREAAARARRRGLNVHARPAADMGPEAYDVVYAAAVLEHVPSPEAFLTVVRGLLRPGGWAILCQPTQDVPSHDVLFVDHLHHFGSAHLAAYARRVGFVEEHRRIGHPAMPQFSLHAWRRAGPAAADRGWDGPPAPTTCVETLQRASQDFARAGTLVEELAVRSRRLAAFGVEEVYALAAAYSTLGDRPPVCGLADTEPTQSLPFPVIAPEALGTQGVTDVLLTMSRWYYPAARQRLAPMGVAVHDLWSAWTA